MVDVTFRVMDIDRTVIFERTYSLRSYGSIPVASEIVLDYVERNALSSSQEPSLQVVILDQEICSLDAYKQIPKVQYRL